MLKIIHKYNIFNNYTLIKNFCHSLPLLFLFAIAIQFCAIEYVLLNALFLIDQYKQNSVYVNL